MSVSRTKPQVILEDISEILRTYGISSEKGDGGTSRFSNDIIKKYGRLNKPLPYELAYVVGIYAISPFYDQLYNNPVLENVFGYTNNDDARKKAIIQSVVLLSTIYTRATNTSKPKNDSDASPADQLAGIVSAVFEYDVPNASPGRKYGGFLNPNSSIISDNCGTGGDTINTYHVSTAAALIAAAHGAKVAKHGSPGNARRSGSSDFVSYLGIPTWNKVELDDIEHMIDKANFGYTEAADKRFKSIHVQTQLLVGMSHMNDIIGPMTSPVLPEKLVIKLVGTNQVIGPEVIGDAYKILNARGITHLKHGLFVRGLNRPGVIEETMDEISILEAGTEAVLFEEGKDPEKVMIGYENFNFGNYVLRKDIEPSSTEAADRLTYTLKVLNGEGTKEATELLLANAAAFMSLTEGKAASLNFADQAEAARNILEEKKWLDTVENVKKVMLRR